MSRRRWGCSGRTAWRRSRAHVIRSLKLKNFRGFKEHTVEFSPFSLLIGQNNAGKTTLIEALRIISAAQAKAANAVFRMAPDDMTDVVTGPVYQFGLDSLDFDERNIHHLYDVETPASIVLTYKNNCTVGVFLGADPADRYCQYAAAGGKKQHGRTQIANQKFSRVFVMPPVGSLLQNETERNRAYLRKHINGYLSYRHIRNQMFEMPEEFSVFKILAESTWERLQVGRIEAGHGELKNEYQLNLRDGKYPAEVARVGSGLQAWIQTLWFLARVERDSVIVLDEPDVYLHADLQKKLVRVISDLCYRQTIIATHSIEMISDLSPDDLIEVKKGYARSKPISTTSQVQALLKQLGTSHHLQLSKLGQAGRVLFVEGKDHTLLSLVASKFDDGLSRRFETLPKFPVGGMSNWPRAAMTAKVLASTGSIESYLVIDRDYYTDDYLNDTVNEAYKSSLNVCVWSKKEIENYFIDPDVIARYISRTCGSSVSCNEIEEAINRIVSELTIDLPEQIAQQIQSSNKRLAVPTALKEARSFIATRKSVGMNDVDLVSGKEVLARISAYSVGKYGVALSANTICRQMPISSIPAEMIKMVRMVSPHS